MAIELFALAIFVGVFAVAALRNVHLGVLMFAAACGVGIWMADMPLDDVVAGFPLGILVLLVGVTYFFGIATPTGPSTGSSSPHSSGWGTGRRCYRRCSSCSPRGSQRWVRRWAGW